MSINALRPHEIAVLFGSFGEDFAFSLDYNLLAPGWATNPNRAPQSWMLISDGGKPLRREGALELIHMALEFNQIVVPDLESEPFSEFHNYQGVLSFIVMGRQLTDTAIEGRYSWSIR